MSIAVLLHLEDHSQWEMIRSYLRNITNPFDLYVNLILDDNSIAQHEIINKHYPNAIITISDPKDSCIHEISGFMKLVKYIIDHERKSEKKSKNEYEYIFKIYAKKESSHLTRRILDISLSSKDTFKSIISYFNENPDLGILGVGKHEFDYMNVKYVINYLKTLGIELNLNWDKYKKEFPTTSDYSIFSLVRHSNRYPNKNFKPDIDMEQYEKDFFSKDTDHQVFRCKPNYCDHSKLTISYNSSYWIKWDILKRLFKSIDINDIINDFEIKEFNDDMIQRRVCSWNSIIQIYSQKIGYQLESILSEDKIKHPEMSKRKTIDVYNPKVEFDISNRIYGISGFMRLYNEEEFLMEVIDSWIDSVDELIIVHNRCTDSTPEIAEAYAQKYPDKIKVYNYIPIVYPFGTKEFDDSPIDHPQNFIHYSNFALSKTSYQICVKIDGDHIGIKPILKKVHDSIHKYKLFQTSLLFNGVNLHYKDDKFYIDKNNPICGDGDISYFSISKDTYFNKHRTLNLESLRCCDHNIFQLGVIFYHVHYMKKRINTIDLGQKLESTLTYYEKSTDTKLIPFPTTNFKIHPSDMCYLYPLYFKFDDVKDPKSINSFDKVIYGYPINKFSTIKNRLDLYHDYSSNTIIKIITNDDEFDREICWLTEMKDKEFVPELINHDKTKHVIVLKYFGEPLILSNIPTNWEEQIRQIIKWLNDNKYQYNIPDPNAVFVNDDKKIIISNFGIEYGHNEIINQIRIQIDSMTSPIKSIQKVENVLYFENYYKFMITKSRVTVIDPNIRIINHKISIIINSLIPCEKKDERNDFLIIDRYNIGLPFIMTNFNPKQIKYITDDKLTNKYVQIILDELNISIITPHCEKIISNKLIIYKSDIVLFLRSIHHTYFSNRRFTMKKIIEILSKITKQIIIIEWINDDDAEVIGYLSESEDDYNKKHFLTELKTYFTNYKYLDISDRRTRELYMAWK
jgi:hypothetical protein